jgi:hypothetical protein
MRGLRTRPATGSRRVAILCVIIAGLALTPARARAQSQQNLLLNGDFSKGSGNSPDHWRTSAWIQKGDTTTYTWTHEPSGAASVEVENKLSNDARWVQSLSLDQGWYYISAEIRADHASPYLTGANISILEDGITSPDLKGTTDWQRVGFYLKVGKRGADVELALRLGGFLNLTMGHAFFRKTSVVKIGSPPPEMTHVFDLDEIRKCAEPGPIGERWTLVATFMALGIVAVFGWRLFGAQSVPMPRAAVRRERRSRAARR